MRISLFLLFIAVVMSGCENKPAASVAAAVPDAGNDDIGGERDKLSAEDRALVDAQEWCVISNDDRLGSMGPPVKFTIKGQTVFTCCSNCKRKAESDPDKTLAKLVELKAKAKSEKEAKK